MRMGKNCKVLGISLNPLDENLVAFLTSDGRIYTLHYSENSYGKEMLNTEAPPLAALELGKYMPITYFDINGLFCFLKFVFSFTVRVLRLILSMKSV